MVRRYQPTLMDYVVIAINPALIMVLIGSLVYFLLEMFYQGQYPERLHFCLTLFIFAAVLIARISMEEGWDHAAPFGAALAVAIILAMHKFVSYEGRSFEAIGWLINYALIGLTWWCAIQLTWDCTLIDETQDASGEGLLQTVGLDREGENGDSTAAESGADAKAEGGSRKAESGSDADAAKGSSGDFEDDMAWSTQKKSTPKKSGKQPAGSVAKKKKSDDEKSWWDKFLERRRRPHAPGVWVVYFSLAALPIFGFGQAFIPVSNVGSRQYAFVLLCVYVAAGLGLLLTTSFLGLRRYLRQRRLEMPGAMAGTWLATGAALIAGLLVLAMLLPRPNAEYAISQLPTSDSAEHKSSKLAVGKEGTRDLEAKDGNGRPTKPEDGQSNTKQSTEGKSNKTFAKDDAEKKGQSGESKGESKGESEAKKSDVAKSQEEQGKETGQEKSQEQARNESGQSNQAKQPNQQSEKSSDQQAQSQTETPQPQSTPSMPDLSLVSSAISNILKWVFYGAIVCIALWWAWRHWSEILAWLAALFGGLSFGRGAKEKEVATPAPKPKSFYDFTDPFASGRAGQLAPAELVRYSFEAFEAWAHDQGFPRETDQTAYEFARQVGGRVSDIAKPARTLAELYSRAAYAPGTLPKASVEQLQELWEVMRQRQAVGV